MQVGWVESIPGGPEGLGYVHTNRQYYPDMTVKSLVGNRASYSGPSQGYIRHHVTNPLPTLLRDQGE